MKLTSRGRYALCALLDLVNNSVGTPIRLRDISLRQNISLNYLEQLFRELRIGGIVYSVRGPGGGYILNRKPEDITIKAILDSVETEEDKLDLGASATKERTVTENYFSQKMNSTLDSVLASDTLAVLISML